MALTARTLAIILLIAGCSAGQSVVVDARGKGDEVEKKYPQDRYIVRSGTGESPEVASEAARLEIAKYFESKISGESVVNEWAKSQTSKGKTVHKSMTELTNTIKVSASREIPGIDIVATEKVRRSDSHEAWAVLEKSKYAAVLGEKILNIDRDVDQSLNSPHDNEMKYLRDLTKTMATLLDRGKARQDLNLLKLGAVPESRGRLLNAVISSLDSLISQAFDVGLVSDGEIESKVLTGLTKGIVDAGIRLKEYPDFSSAVESGADLIMTVKHDVSSNTQTRKMGSKEYTFDNFDWVLSVNAMDPQTEQVIDTIVQNERISEMGGESRARDRMVSKILQNQVPAITSWVFALIFKPDEN